MKYPRLPEELNLARKLMDQDIADIQKAYQQALPFPTRKELHRARKLGFELQSKTAWREEIAEMYGVSYTSIYIWTDEEQRHKLYSRNNKMWQQKYKNMTEAERKAHSKKNTQKQAAIYARYPVHKAWVSLKTAKNRNQSHYKGVPVKEIMSWNNPEKLLELYYK